MALGSGVRLNAQDSEPAATLRVDTQRVLLDVVVKDKKGNVVTHLKPDDFTVYEDGIPQAVTSFEAPSKHATLQADKIVVHDSRDLTKIGVAPVTVLVLDELNTSFEDMAFARQKIEKYLEAQPAVLKQPTILLAATNTRFQVIHDYTQDREDLRVSLKKHFPELPYKMMRSGTNSAGAYERMAQSLNSLYQIAVASRGLAGRKSVIWVGKGFPSVNLLVLDNESTTLMQDAIQRITRILLDTRITIYTIDPAANLLTQGFVASPDQLNDFESRTDGQPFADEIKFSTLVPTTGGQAFFDRNDVDQELQNALEQGANIYTLTYKPGSPSQTSSAYRHIRIALRNPNQTAVTRDGYYTGGDSLETFDAVSNKAKTVREELASELGGAALSTLPYTGVTAAVEKKDDFTLLLKVAAGSLQWTATSNGKYRSEITVLSVAFNAKGKALAHDSKELQAGVDVPIQDPTQKAGFLGRVRTKIVIIRVNGDHGRAVQKDQGQSPDSAWECKTAEPPSAQRDSVRCRARLQMARSSVSIWQLA